MKKLNSKCSNRDISACMMLKLVTYFNRMLKKSNIELGDVEITQTSTETITTSEDTSRSMNVENMSEEAQLSQVIADKLYNFVRTRSLKWKVSLQGTRCNYPFPVHVFRLILAEIQLKIIERFRFIHFINFTLHFLCYLFGIERDPFFKNGF